MDGDRQTLGSSQRGVVPLASLPAPQRRLVVALLAAARSTSVRPAAGTNGKGATPMNRIRDRARGVR